MLLTNTTQELRHCWHVVATTDELGDEPLGVLLLGEPWVVVRLDGIVRAFVDRCPHRLAPMSAGAVVPGEHGAELQCGYHGWRFDGDARCTAIPALSADDHIPGRARLVPAFGVAERYGLIWIAPEEPLADLPTFEWYGADGYDSAMTELVRTRCRRRSWSTTSSTRALPVRARPPWSTRHRRSTTGHHPRRLGGRDDLRHLVPQR